MLPQNIKDSYAGFRSDFIHFSTSIISPLKHGGENRHNSFHLTPKTFAHFWSWWHLFDGVLSLPIRQGSLFPDSRPPSKKFGHHLATIKYRITFSPLYIAHVYKVDSGDAWSAGESRCVGVSLTHTIILSILLMSRRTRRLKPFLNTSKPTCTSEKKKAI